MRRKSMLNKKEMVVISSLVAIPLTTVLIAMVTLRAGKRSPKRSTLLRQARSETNTNTNNKTTTTTTNTTTARNNNNNHRQRKEEATPPQLKSFIQESRTGEAAQITVAPMIPTNIPSKDITIPAAIEVIVPSQVHHSRSIGCATVVVSPSHTQEQEISISDEAKKAGESLKELIKAAIKDAKDSAKGTGKKIKEETVGISATTDSKDIQSLRDNVNTLVGLFEKMMAEIRKEHYNEQIILLQSYKDLLRTQIKVARARGMMASKLKPGA
jgi:DNA-binding protein YbaB